MKQVALKFWIVCLASVAFFVGCNQSTADEKSKTEPQADKVNTKADPSKLKEDIQALETAWANADNARDVNALAAFYSSDAVSMVNNQPMISGHDALKKDIETSLAKRPKGSTTAYDVMDAFGCENYATETGKITRKDSTGKIISTGKYMAIWEKRDGKWICIRDIGNDDAKEK
jgi:uncharacterized protein (TIGR02246 family)